jgi:phage baseplate assembly protein W
MATYIGFSTISANKPRSTQLQPGRAGGTGNMVAPIVYGKKFRMVDEQLVLQDFINALNIQQGQKVGNPGYGTTIWTYVFEPNTADMQTELQTEVRRVGGLDPRLNINSVNAYPKENGILIEVELAVAPFNNPQTLSLFFNGVTGSTVVQ